MESLHDRVLGTLRLKQRIGVPAFVAGLVGLSVAVLLGGNWLLLEENTRLQSALQQRTTAMGPPVGTQLPELHGLTPGGESYILDYDETERRTVLFVFSPTCSLSDRNWPYWKAVAEQLDTRRFRPAYVNTSQGMPARYRTARHFHPDAPIVARADPGSMVDYGLSMTPMLLLIDQAGVLQEAWLGVTREEERREIASSLGVDLADVTLARATGG